jgi:hypothetical protein
MAFHGNPLVGVLAVHRFCFHAAKLCEVTLSEDEDENLLKPLVRDSSTHAKCPDLLGKTAVFILS